MKNMKFLLHFSRKTMDKLYVTTLLKIANIIIYTAIKKRQTFNVVSRQFCWLAATYQPGLFQLGIRSLSFGKNFIQAFVLLSAR